ncbi:hypothetical protein C8R46DRAFT_1015208 [Mycena filopes]|nr:hypothetical protein C8R46DRAFT_1015208 [Mycena filopes]
MSTVPPADSTVPPADSTSPPTTDPVPHTPVEGLWFNDGTLVLQAGSAAFRVYAGFLAERSPVFHDMLQFPQPDDGDFIEGCPVVQLSDDKRDLECFLKALFDYEFFLPYPAKTDFDTISAIIRLSMKYQVDALRKRGLVHLSSAFPTLSSQYSTWSESASWDVDNHEWLRIVLFGQELSLDWILPLAFYRLTAVFSSNEILNGVSGEDGVHRELSAADKLRCVEQSLALATSTSSAILNFLWDPPVFPGCERQAKCTAARLKARREAEARRWVILPLRLWETEHWATLSSTCAHCQTQMKTAHARALQKLWDGLPQRFGLADWAVLEQVKAAALA